MISYKFGNNFDNNFSNNPVVNLNLDEQNRSEQNVKWIKFS